jgi:hypothetical protein
VPTPNYQFERRKRDNDKKAKKAEKKRRKLENAASPAPVEPDGTAPAAETP